MIFSIEPLVPFSLDFLSLSERFRKLSTKTEILLSFATIFHFHYLASRWWKIVFMNLG